MPIVKLEYSFTRTTVAVEGEQEHAQAVMAEMQRMVGSFASAQNTVVDITPRVEERHALPAAPHYAPPRRKKSRRKPATTGAGGNGGSSATPKAVAGQTPVKENRGRKAGRDSCIRHVYELMRDGYFVKGHTVEEIREKLGTDGHHFPSNAISSRILGPLKKKQLVRSKNADGNYVYIQGPNRDVPGS